MRPKGSAATLEARRRLAARLLTQGHGIRDVARRIGAAPSSVKRWSDALKHGGKQALKSKPHAGRPPRLSPRQKTELMRLLAAGSRVSGMPGRPWTCERVGEVIWRHFGVRYHPDHISRLLRALGFRYQKNKKFQPTGSDSHRRRRWSVGA